MMKRRTKFLLAGTLAIAVVGGSAAAVAATGGDDTSSPAITGPDLEQATRAALAETGGGRVTGTEVGDEEGAFEVEVTQPDGSQVDVHLDDSFHVLGAQADHDGEHDGAHDSEHPAVPPSEHSASH